MVDDHILILWFNHETHSLLFLLLLLDLLDVVHDFHLFNSRHEDCRSDISEAWLSLELSWTRRLWQAVHDICALWILYLEVVVVVLITLSFFLTSILTGIDSTGYNEVNYGKGEAGNGCDIRSWSESKTLCDERAIRWSDNLTKA